MAVCVVLSEDLLGGGVMYPTNHGGVSNESVVSDDLLSGVCCHLCGFAG